MCWQSGSATDCCYRTGQHDVSQPRTASCRKVVSDCIPNSGCILWTVLERVAHNRRASYSALQYHCISPSKGGLCVPANVPNDRRAFCFELFHRIRSSFHSSFFLPRKKKSQVGLKGGHLICSYVVEHTCSLLLMFTYKYYSCNPVPLEGVQDSYAPAKKKSI